MIIIFARADGAAVMAGLTYKHGDDDDGVCLVVQDVE